MRIREWFGLASLVVAVLLSGCQRNDVRKARLAMDLVHTMGTELQTTGAQTLEAFTARRDFEEMRRAFGDGRFDAGIPLGPEFQKSLQSMVRDLEAQLGREPRDAEFLRKAVRRVRKFNQWWIFARKHLETRRDELARMPVSDADQRMLGGRLRREDVITVMEETIRAIGAFEVATQRCIRGIEDLLTQP